MGTIAILRLGQENRTGDIPATLRLSQDHDRPLVEVTATLPSAIALLHHYNHWQAHYQALISDHRRLDAPSQQISNVSSLEDCLAAANHLAIALNQWLNASSFRPIKEALLQHLSLTAPVQVLLQAEDTRLQRLPWHLWDFFQHYTGAELAISPTTYQHPEQAVSRQQTVRILAILGDSRGIDTGADQTMLSQLPDASVRFLVEPSRQDVSDELWEKGWDILFFAGHSCTQDAVGMFALNPTDRLTIAQLRYALKTAIAAGLQLAIFNSCDGLGLAHQLVDLHIPQMIVMREPVPDRVAQEFLKYFLREFAGGRSLYQSVRTARERLQGLEGEFPCASWLPVIVQNPVATPPSWQQLVRGNDRRREPRLNTVTLVFTDLAGSTAMKNSMVGADLATRNQQFFDSVLKPHRQRVEANLSGYRGRVVKTEGDGHFLVFANAASAARWVTNLQLSHLHDPIFTPLGTVKLRVGIHTGSPLHDGLDFIGQEVDYAARVEALANAGQVLLSQATVAALQQEPGGNWRFHDHGTIDLKGIGQEPVYELLWGNRSPQPIRRPGGSKRPRLGLLGSLAISAASTVVIIALRWFTLLETPELLAYDHLMRQRPSERIDSRVLVVEITEKDADLYGDPLSDQQLAKLFAKLLAYKPRAIGLDLHRTYPYGEGQQAFRDSFQKNPNLFLVCAFAQNSSSYDPPAHFSPQQKEKQMGFSDLPLDVDTVVRRHILLHNPELLETRSACLTPYSFSLRLAEPHLQHQGIEITPINSGRDLKVGNQILKPMPSRFGGYQDWAWRGHQWLINYRAIDKNNPEQWGIQRLTLDKVMTKKLDLNFIRDRVVLIGAGINFDDDHKTPYGVKPGIFIHAHAVSQLLSMVDQHPRPIIWVLPQWGWFQWGDMLWVLVWSSLGAVSAWYWRSTWKLAIVCVVMAVGLYYLCLLILIEGGWMPLLPSMSALLLTIAILLAYNTVYIRSRE